MFSRCCGICYCLDASFDLRRWKFAPPLADTHWGQQVFHLLSPLPLLAGQTTRLRGTLEMKRTEESARLYNVRFRYEASRRRTGADREDPGAVLMKGKKEELVYQIP